MGPEAPRVESFGSGSSKGPNTGLQPLRSWLATAAPPLGRLITTRLGESAEGRRRTIMGVDRLTTTGLDSWATTGLDDRAVRGPTLRDTVDRLDEGAQGSRLTLEPSVIPTATGVPVV